MDDAVIGEPLSWEAALPLIRALRDIAQCSTDPTATEVATTALHTAFPDVTGLDIMFGRESLK